MNKWYTNPNVALALSIISLMVGCISAGIGVTAFIVKVIL